jgi:hypothetical protein
MSRSKRPTYDLTHVNDYSSIHITIITYFIMRQSGQGDAQICCYGGLSDSCGSTVSKQMTKFYMNRDRWITSMLIYLLCLRVSESCDGLHSFERQWLPDQGPWSIAVIDTKLVQDILGTYLPGQLLKYLTGSCSTQMILKTRSHWLEEGFCPHNLTRVSLHDPLRRCCNM